MKASELKEILDQHRLWNQTDGVQGERADLTRADVRGANLSGAYLRYADLRGTNLQGTNLRGANLTGANLCRANLTYANLLGANLGGANLRRADFYNTILPDISWIIPGCLVQLNRIMDDFYLKKENELVNFVQDSFAFFIQNNVAEETFDMLVEDRIIRNIPYWVKYSGLKQIESV